MLSCSHADNAQESGEELRSILNEADSAFRTCKYGDALRLYYDAISNAEVSKAANRDSVEALAYQFTGNIHLMFGNPIQAVNSYRMALDEARKVDSTSFPSQSRVRMLSSMVQAFTACGNIDSAKIYNRRLLDLKNADRRDINFFHDLDNVYISYAEGNPHATLALIDSAYRSMEVNGYDPKYEIYLRSVSSLVYERLGMRDSVISSLNVSSRLPTPTEAITCVSTLIAS